MNPTILNRFYRISIKGLILDETRTKFLVVQEDNGKWELPGGGIDWGETVEVCMRRELKEEMGLELISIRKTPSYFFTGVTELHNTPFANVVYEITVANLVFTPSEECTALKFVTKGDAMELDAFSSVYMLAEQFDSKNHTIV